MQEGDIITINGTIYDIRGGNEKEVSEWAI